MIDEKRWNRCVPTFLSHNFSSWGARFAFFCVAHALRQFAFNNGSPCTHCRCLMVIPGRGGGRGTIKRAARESISALVSHYQRPDAPLCHHQRTKRALSLISFVAPSTPLSFENGVLFFYSRSHTSTCNAFWFIARSAQLMKLIAPNWMATCVESWRHDFDWKTMTSYIPTKLKQFRKLPEQN